MATEDLQVTMGGEMRMRGRYTENISTADSKPVKTDSYAWYDSRIRLYVDAEVSPRLQGYLMLESGDGQNANYNWGNFNSKPSGLSIIEAWILYKGTGLLGIPSGIKTGHMPLALGEKLFFDHTRHGDDAIVVFIDPNKQLHIGALTIKASEGNFMGNSDDTDIYVGVIVYKLDDKNTIGSNYAYVNNSDADLSFQNLEFHGKGNVSGLDWKGSGNVQFGDKGVKKWKGYALLAGLGYKIDPATLRASFGLGSGDSNLTDNDINTFHTVLGPDDLHYTVIYEYLVRTADLSGVNPGTGFGRGTGIANTTYCNLGADFDATKDLKIMLDAFLLRATKLPSGYDNEIGLEADLKAIYKITKNLSYMVVAAYFDPGDFYGPDAKGVTAAKHALTLSF